VSLAAPIKRLIPAGMKQWIREARLFVSDVVHPPPEGCPPLHLQYDGPRGYDVFRRNGQEAFAFYRNEAGLTPEAAILDIGSGIGRKTVPLVGYLAGAGRYAGIDVDPRGIRWCTRHISRRDPRFTFSRIDVYNKHYNPRGALRPESVVFPFPDGSFDLVALWSVFTHIYPSAIEHYLAEAARLLRAGGRICASYFLTTDEEAMRSGTTEVGKLFELQASGCWTNNPDIPEHFIAVDETWLRAAYAKCGLTIEEPIRFGSWSGHAVPDAYDNLNFQDIVIARRN
jgi:SAM-dependent methyltransferase